MQQVVDMPATDAFTLCLFQSAHHISCRQVNEIQIIDKLLDRSSRPIRVKTYMWIARKSGEYLCERVSPRESSLTF
jgi:hypothetical protein